MPSDLAVLGGASKPPWPLPCLTTWPRRFWDFAKAFLLDFTDQPMMAATQKQPMMTPKMMPTVAMVWVPWDWRSSMFLGRMGKLWVELALKLVVAFVPLRLVQGRQ